MAYTREEFVAVITAMLTNSMMADNNDIKTPETIQKTLIEKAQMICESIDKAYNQD